MLPFPGVTNEPGTSEVEYWLSNTSIHKTVSNNTLTNNHRIDLTGLEKNATYFFMVKSTTIDSNKASEQGVFILTPNPEVGMQAPDFTLTSLDGNAINLSDYRGKVVMLDFWIWSCSGCRGEISIYRTFLHKFRREKNSDTLYQRKGKRGNNPELCCHRENNGTYSSLSGWL